MPLDGISSRFLGLELSQDLKDARVDRITQPGRFDLLLTLRVPGANRRLFISCNPSSPRAYLLPAEEPAPGTGRQDRQPPMFCMLLRKHLQGARLQTVSTADFERVLSFNFQVRNEYGDLTTRHLVCELMGRYSNIILVNEAGRILDALVHVDGSVSSRREIMPARAYTRPPDQGKIRPDHLLQQLIAGTRPDFLTTALTAADSTAPDRLLLDHIAGLAPVLCREICLRAGLSFDRNTEVKSLTPADLNKLADSLQYMLSQALSDQASPCLIFPNGLSELPTDFYSLPLPHAGELQTTASLSEAMGLFYPSRERAQRLRQQQNSLQKEVQKAIRHQVKLLGIYERDLKSGQAYEHYRKLGDLIYSNLHVIRTGLKTATVTDYTDPEARELDIELKAELTPSQNAQRYYRLYQRNKSRFETAQTLKGRAEAELAYLRTLLTMVETAEDTTDIRDLKAEWQLVSERDKKKTVGQQGAGRGKKSAQKAARQGQGRKGGKKAAAESGKPLPPRRFTSGDGFTILVGRNNRQNDELTLRTAQKDDLWLHLQKAPGTHVIIRTGGQTVPDSTLEQAAGLTAWFSLGEGRRQAVGSGSAVEVDFCPVAHVRKPSGARPGMVIYDRYRTIRVKPLAPADLPTSD